MELVGRKFYEWRIQRGLTQSELSRRSGIPQANLSKIEQGRQDPTVSTLVRICRAIGVPPTELFTEEPPARRPLLTRGFLEKIARAVAGSPGKLKEGEKEIVERLKDILPGFRRRPLSTNKVYRSWQELKQRFTPEEVRTLTERVQDAHQRLRKILGPR